jgi:hypothetical protein
MSVDPAVLESLHRGLRDQLAAFTDSDEWLDWLAAARHFHRHSPNNQMLLAAQGALPSRAPTTHLNRFSPQRDARRPNAERQSGQRRRIVLEGAAVQ